MWIIFHILFLNLRTLFVGEYKIPANLFLGRYLYGVTLIDEFDLIVDEIEFLEKV